MTQLVMMYTTAMGELRSVSVGELVRCFTGYFIGCVDLHSR